MFNTENMNVKKLLFKNYITCEEDFNLFYESQDEVSLDELDEMGKQIMRVYMEEGYAEIFVLPNYDFSGQEQRRYRPFLKDLKIYLYDNKGYYCENFQELMEQYAIEHSGENGTERDGFFF